VPEVLEVESYRQLADRTVGATIVRGWADGYAAKKLTSPGAWSRAVKNLTITGTSRRGKLLLVETSGVTLGVRFGMTGVLLIDHEAGIDGLFYGPHVYKSGWIRGGLELNDGRKIILHDPRRMGRFEIDPDLSQLGPDALTLSRKEFEEVVRVRRGPGTAIKARLLDQSVIAGVGNLLADEILFRAGLDPRTPTGSLDDEEKNRLFKSFTSTMRTLKRRGGSHLGDHMEARFPGGLCPRDGGQMLVATVGGRTTYWCSIHQPDGVTGSAPGHSRIGRD
jgi:formamidopyrimidine-DNA glycosylase